MMNILNTTSSSVLKGKAIYSDLLVKAGYKRHEIDDLAISEFLEYEQDRIGEPSDLHLLAIKKILLYSIPIVAPRNSNNRRGISLTAQFNTEYIINNATKDRLKMVSGDKYTLLGFAFLPELTNNLDISVFEWKYYYRYPAEYISSEIDLSHLKGLKKHIHRDSNNLISYYLIEPSYFEDVDLYNNILTLIKLKLQDYTRAITSIQNQCDHTNHKDVEEYTLLQQLSPFNDNPIIHKLNQLLEKQIDTTFTLSYYETLQATANWLLYNQIFLYGFESNLVNNYLSKLKYTKEENHKVFLQLAKEAQEQLELTRAEKITREQFPFYFSEIDRRGIFKRFTRFSLSKLTSAHRKEVSTLLEKEIAFQRAIIENKCPHILIIKKLSQDINAYKELEPFIDQDRKTNDDHTHYCKNCSYPLLCEHEVEFYSNVVISKESEDGNDQIYAIQQNIINRYKSTQQSMDESDLYSYSCKYCSKELGKSDDIIQVAIKEVALRGYAPIESDDVRTNIYFLLSNLLKQNVDPLVLNLDKKKMMKLLYPIIREQLDSIIYSFRKFKDDDTIDNHIQFSALVLILCALISLNINVLKSEKVLLYPESIKITKKEYKKPSSDDELTENSSDEESSISGGSIKVEFANAFAIIKNSAQYKLLMISDEKIKAMLIDYYRKIAKDIGDIADVSSMIRSNEDKFIAEVKQSPIYAYLRYIVCRNKNIVISNLPFDAVMGVNITRNNNPGIYSNVPKDTTKGTDSRSKYIRESFQNIRSFISNNKYKEYDINPELSEFIKSYELEQHNKIFNRTKNPKFTLDEVNSRESEFKLNNLNLIYCNSTELQKHKWIKRKCTLCEIDMKSISASHNTHIENLINREISVNAFFELYSMACPIKDNHIFEDKKCAQCGVEQQQLLSHDLKYYKKYLTKFDEYQLNILKQLVQKANSAIVEEKYSNPTAPLINQSDKELDSNINRLLLIITNIYDIKGTDITELSESSIDSYIRLIYERYTYAKNVSYDMSKHADVEFYDFVKVNFFKGSKPNKITMADLPEYDYQNYEKDIKIYQLLKLLETISKNDASQVIALGKFLIQKIIAQEARRKDFNFAKLKVMRQIVEESDEIIETIMDEEDEENEDTDAFLFNTYDIDMDDMEDNLDGDIDY